MQKQNRIIALIDFSEYSANVVQFAAKFASSTGAEPIFVHQVPRLVPALADAESKTQIIEYEIQVARKDLEELTKEYFVYPPKLIVTDKEIVKALESLRDDLYFDWVCAGLKGTGTLKKIFVGSTMLRIIDNTPYLSILIPIKNEVVIPEELVVAVSPKYPVNLTHLEQVIHSLTLSIKKVEFISIIDHKADTPPSVTYLNELVSTFEQFNSSSNFFTGNNPLEELKKNLQEKPNTFLVLQRGSREFSDLIFRKFLINELVYNGSIPIIIL